jgi:methyl-galactoside transport system permease protein
MKSLLAFVKTHCILAALLLALFVLVIVEPALFSFRHFHNILFEAAPLMLLAVPFALCVGRGHFDISFGRCAAFAGIVAASLLQSADFPGRMFEHLPHLPVILPILFVMLLCAGFSALNLFATIRLRLPPVATGLVFAGFFQGFITLYLARKDEHDRVLEHFTAGFLAFGTGVVGGDPPSVPWVVIVAFVICGALALLTKSKFARFFVGTGKFTLLPVVMICGCLYALSGTMTAAKTAVIDSHFMLGADFTALAGMLAGGVSLFGGSNGGGAHSITGTVLGAAAGTLLCTAVLYALDFIFPVNGVLLLTQTLIIGAALVLDRLQAKTQMLDY